jgi:hypothetical protein
MTTCADPVRVYSVGLVYASVCTALTDEETTRQLNLEHPAGTDNGWMISDEPFADGSPNPSKCPDAVTYNQHRRHILYNC